MLSKNSTFPRVADEIYHLAKIKDQAALLKLRSFYSYVNKENVCALRALAREGDIESVMFFVTKCEGPISFAVGGAAEGNQIELMEMLIQKGAQLDDAVYGAGINNRIELMNQLIQRGASKNSAIQGLGVSGNLEFIEKLLKEGASINSACFGAATGNHVKLTLALLERGASTDRSAFAVGITANTDLINEFTKRGAPDHVIVEGIKEGNWLFLEENRLRIISNVENEKLREKLLELTKKLTKRNDITLPKKIDRIRGLMIENQFNYVTARNWLITNIHFWFLQGIKIIDKGIPREIFFIISSFLMGSSIIDTLKFFEKHRAIMPKKLRDLSLQQVETKYQPSFFSSITNYWPRFYCYNDEIPSVEDQKKKEIMEIEARFQKRMAF